MNIFCKILGHVGDLNVFEPRPCKRKGCNHVIEAFKIPPCPPMPKVKQPTDKEIKQAYDIVRPVALKCGLSLEECAALIAAVSNDIKNAARIINKDFNSKIPDKPRHLCLLLKVKDELEFTGDDCLFIAFDSLCINKKLVAEWYDKAIKLGVSPKNKYLENSLKTSLKIK